MKIIWQEDSRLIGLYKSTITHNWVGKRKRSLPSVLLGIYHCPVSARVDILTHSCTITMLLGQNAHRESKRREINVQLCLFWSMLDVFIRCKQITFVSKLTRSSYCSETLWNSLSNALGWSWMRGQSDEGQTYDRIIDWPKEGELNWSIWTWEGRWEKRSYYKFDLRDEERGLVNP